MGTNIYGTQTIMMLVTFNLKFSLENKIKTIFY